MHARLAVARRELPRAVRIAIAAALSWWVARLLGADRPVFAVIVPMVAIRDDTHAALSLSLGRMLGVIAGVLLGVAVVAVAGLSTAAIVLLLLVGLAIGLFLPTGLVAQRQRLALRLAIQVRRLARDLASFAHRDDVEDQWREAARRLPPVIGLVAAASSRVLAGEGCSQEVASARDIMADYRREDARPVSAILRRPLVLLLDELAEPPA